MAHGRQAMHLPCYGAAAGQRLIDAAEQGPVVLGELIQWHGVDCDYSVPGRRPPTGVSAAPCPA
jgi:hypothetical protein